MEAKRCFKCQEVKPLTAFYVHPAMGDGRLNKCKECAKKDVRKNYLENIEFYKEQERNRAMLPHRVAQRAEYQATEAGKAAVRAGKLRYMMRNPVKRKAHIAVSNAIRDGVLERQPCEICQESKAQAHHDDYSKPLDVRWLCTKHHAEWHRNNTPLCPEQEKAA